MSKKSNQLTVFIPSLLTPGLKASQINPNDIPELNSISLILSRATVNPIISSDFLQRCFELLGYLPNNNHTQQYDLPIGPILYGLEKDKSSSDSSHWIYNMSPVFLYPDMDQLVLANDLSREITSSEAGQICQAINDYFNQSEQDKTWQIVNPGKNQLFLLCSNGNPIQTTPLDYVLGLPINQFLPSGKEADYWNQTLNEIQMLLFTLPLNKKRQQQGQIPINSLWPWGGGNFPIATKTTSYSPLSASWDKVFTEHPVLEQLCRFNSFEQYPVSSLVECDFNPEHNYLLISDQLLKAYNGHDIYSWLESLKDSEEKIFTPVLTALKDKKLNQVNIITSDKQYFSITRRQALSWWKRKKSFTRFLQ